MFTLYLANGGSINEKDCKWEDIVNGTPIVAMSYILPNKKTVLLQGYEKYLCKKEIYSFVNVKRKSILNTINLFGKFGNQVYQFSVHRKGKSAQIINQWGLEFRPLIIEPKPPIIKKKKVIKQYLIKFGSPQTTNHQLWKVGVCKSRPKTEIV